MQSAWSTIQDTGRSEKKRDSPFFPGTFRIQPLKDDLSNSTTSLSVWRSRSISLLTSPTSLWQSWCLVPNQSSSRQPSRVKEGQVTSMSSPVSTGLKSSPKLVRHTTKRRLSGSSESSQVAGHFLTSQTTCVSSRISQISNRSRSYQHLLL